MLLPPEDYAPRSLRNADARTRRRALLDAAHVRPLARFAAALRQNPGVEVPDFDPLDGGIKARALFLFEKPGPMTADSAVGRRQGSGLISRNNDDPTAEATFNFMVEAGLPREFTVTWNAVPWWNGTRKITRSELIAGIDSAKELISLLPELRVVILVGAKAARARPFLSETGSVILQSDHPSPLVRARFPDRWRAIPTAWAAVRPYIER
ncbi:MAG: uracil-DNA glycosylase [Verrucomicrobiaceae bacterium]|nr:MAG: uracil-DNA glycosylase [Verrucomicrobiaceae bacterium]